MRGSTRIADKGILLAALAAALFSGCATERPADLADAGVRPPPCHYFPAAVAEGGWVSLTRPNKIPTEPEKAEVRTKAGMDWDRLKRGIDMGMAYGTSNAIVVVRNGWIVQEWGDLGFRFTGSSNKGVTGVAMAKILTDSNRGQLRKRIGLEDFVYAFLPPSFGQSDPRKRDIRVRHLLGFETGISGRLRDVPSTLAVPNYFDEILREPVVAPPGTRWEYNSFGPDMMSLVAEDVTGQRLGDYFWGAIGSRIGMAPDGYEWVAQEGHSVASRGGRDAGLNITPRNYARLGYLLLRRGTWEAQSIIDPGVLDQFTTWQPWVGNASSAVEGWPGHEHWSYVMSTNRTTSAPFTAASNKVWHSFYGPGVPEDAFGPHGGSVHMVVIPSLDMIVVHQGWYPSPYTEDGRREYLTEIVRAIVAPGSAPECAAVDVVGQSDAGAR